MHGGVLPGGEFPNHHVQFDPAVLVGLSSGGLVFVLVGLELFGRHGEEEVERLFAFLLVDFQFLDFPLEILVLLFEFIQVLEIGFLELEARIGLLD